MPVRERWHHAQQAGELADRRKYLPRKDFNSCDEKHAQVLKTVFRS